MLKYVVLLSVALCSFKIAVPCQAAGSPQTSDKAEGVILFEATGLPFDGNLMPASLAVALEANSAAKKFRTDWNFSVLGGSGIGAVLYDRGSKTLKYFERNMDSSSVATTKCTFHDVTDDLIYKLRADIAAPRNPGEVKPSIATIFDGLLKYGCHRVGGWEYRLWSESSPSRSGKWK